jgi:hypothetical protein
LSIFASMFALAVSVSSLVRADDRFPLMSEPLSLRNEIELTASMIKHGDLSAARENIERIDHIWNGAERADKTDLLAPRIVDRAIDRGIDRALMTLRQRPANLAQREHVLRDLVVVLNAARR